MSADLVRLPPDSAAMAAETVLEKTPAPREPGKVRRVDFYPDEYLAGTAELTPEQKGLYWDVCVLTYSRGASIPDDDRENARIFRVDLRTWKRIKAELIAKGKLRQEHSCLTNKRCGTELAKAHGRIEDARRNARTRWTSAEDRADDSPTVGPTVPESNADHSQTIDDKSLSVSSENNALADAPAFSSAYANHQPINLPTTKEEEPPPLANEKTYAFDGNVIKLNQADFDKWQTLYRETIPDLVAQLTDDDAFYDRTLQGKERKQWFQRLSKKLNNHHQRVLTKRTQHNGNANLNESF